MKLEGINGSDNTQNTNGENRREPIVLRGYQEECIQGCRDSIRRGFGSMACVLPTGSGKTTIFGSITSRYLENNPTKRVVVVSHLGLLTSQTCTRFRNEWGVRAGILQGDVYPSWDSRAVITTMQSFREKDKQVSFAKTVGGWFAGIDALNIGLIIIDECHYAGAESYQKIIEAYPNAIVIGFTATPFRQNKLMTNLFEAVAYTCSMQRLIDEGYLVPPVLRHTPFDTTNQAEMFASIIKIYKEKHEGHKAVVYLKTIEEAELLRNVLVDSGITASAVTSRLTGKARDTLLSDYRKGRGPDILTTVDVLTAGFDSPNIRALFIPYKVGSVTTYLQRVGRGLRPDHGKAECDIYVGSESPGIEPGYWEKITKAMLNQGRQDYDNYLDAAEFAENDFSEEMYKWTMDVVNMAKDVKKLGMNGLFDMIVTKQLPEEMLNIMINEPPTTTKKNAKTKTSKSQEAYLKANSLWREGITKQEANAMIYAHKRANGWKPSEDEFMKSGKHEGKHISQVPAKYFFTLMRKFPNSDAYEQYQAYKKKYGLEYN